MLTPWKESYDQPRQHIKKKRYHFANKSLSSQGYGFSSGHVWMRELDVTKAEHQRIDAFELWCWRRLLRVPWFARRSNQSVLKEINVQFSSVAQSCPTLCDPMNCSTPGLPVHHQLPEFTQTHVHRVRGAIQPSHPGSSPSSPAPTPSQHQSLFQ